VESANLTRLEDWPLERHVKCPKCGRTGKVKVSTVKAKGETYRYLIVVHPDAKKCVIGKVTEKGEVVPTGGERRKRKPVAREEVPAGPKAEVAPKEAILRIPLVEMPVGVPSPKQLLEVPEEVKVAVGRRAWRIAMLSASWGSLREAPTQANLELFERSAKEAEANYGIPADELVEAARAYVEACEKLQDAEARKKARMPVNEKLAVYVGALMLTAYPLLERFIDRVADEAAKSAASAVSETLHGEVEKRLEEVFRGAEERLDKAGRLLSELLKIYVTPDVIESYRKVKISHRKRTEEESEKAKKFEKAMLAIAKALLGEQTQEQAQPSSG
jgi:transcription elongation factor Elf1